MLRHVAIGVAVVLAIIAVRFATSDASDLVRLEHVRIAAESSIGPDRAFFASGLDGDGATFALIAADPLGIREGKLLFESSYRYMRGGYSWLSALVVAGHDSLILLGLSAVGLLSLGAVAFCASVLRTHVGLRAWLLVCNPALVLGAMGDTAEPLSLLVLIVALATGSLLATWSLALLRPSYLVAASNNHKGFIAGVATALAAKVYWSWHFGESLFVGASTLSWPLFGVLASPSLFAIVIAAGGVATASIGLVRRDLAWTIAGTLVLCFAPVVYDTPTNALRASGFLPVLWAFGVNWEPTLTLRSLAGLDPLPSS